MKPLKPAVPILEPGSQKNNSHLQLPDKKDKFKITYNKKAESEFFVDNSALAGFTGERILYMAARELIENALDSCETFSLLPSVKISLKTFDQTNDLWTLTCEDNGTGITSDKLPIAVCSFLTSAKYMEKQQRGLFGVGLKMVAAFNTKDTDFPIKVWSKSLEESDEYYFELRTDIGTNKPLVLKKIINKHDSQIRSTSGFKIQVVLRARLMPITKNKIYDYVTQTSIINPYAYIVFETDDGTFTFDRRTPIMPVPAREILPHPSDMDLQTLKKAISKFTGQKITLPKILSSSFQKFSYDKAKEILSSVNLDSDLKNPNIEFSEHDLIKIVNICKKTKFQNPNTDHLSPIGREILTIGMMSEYTIVSNKNIDNIKSTINTINNNDDPKSVVDTQLRKSDNDLINNKDYEMPTTTTTTDNSDVSKSNFSVKVLQPVLTAYTSRTGVINNRPTIIETGLAYGGDISSFKLYRFANKIPLLYDEGSDVAREVVSEVEINKMGITKKQAKEQFSNPNKESKRDRVIEVLPIHIFFHICSTKIPYKTAGKESIASEGELKFYMKSCLSELYRKLSTQIRKELKIKEAENKMKLYKHYLPFIVEAITESLGVKNSKLSESFSLLIENHLAKKPDNDILKDDKEFRSSQTSDIIDNNGTSTTKNIVTNITNEGDLNKDLVLSKSSQKEDNSSNNSFKRNNKNENILIKKNNLKSTKSKSQISNSVKNVLSSSSDINKKSKISFKRNTHSVKKNTQNRKSIVNKFENSNIDKKSNNNRSETNANQNIKNTVFPHTLDSFRQKRVHKGKIK
ncbi:MAG TPA: DNA topoisomerase VI subunit B [Candidatus Nitrosocosmicus sp.]